MAGKAGAAGARVPSLAYATRGEAAKLILEARKGSVPLFRSNGEFPDVRAGDPYERYVVGAARYGILEPQPVTRELRPALSVTRGEFLAMLGRAYAVPAFPQNFEDVAPNAWYAPYAGMAERYRLFPVDPEPGRLRPEDPVRRLELGLALRIFLNVREREASSDIPPLSREQTRYGLTLYQLISTKTTELTIVNMPQYMAPKAAPVQRKDAPSATPPTKKPSVPTAEYSDEEKRDALLGLINQERTRIGAPRLGWNETLSASAQDYSARMTREGFFSHVSPGGQTLDDRVSIASLSASSVTPPDCVCIEKAVFAENLARATPSAADAFRVWMNSQAHRNAMLSPLFTDIGIGLSGDVWVTHFGGLRHAE